LSVRPSDANMDSPRTQLLDYLSYILSSMESKHEHKIAYAVYVLDMCLDRISWTVETKKEAEE